jgi:hypothetical protein
MAKSNRELAKTGFEFGDAFQVASGPPAADDPHLSSESILKRRSRRFPVLQQRVVAAIAKALPAA